MADYTLAVDITAGTAGFTAGMSRVTSSAKSAAGSVKASFDQGLKSIEKNADSYDRVSGSLVKIGAVGAVGLAAAGKAAMDWESQWAGVTKTVNGSAKEMAVLEGQLRGLAKTLPASHEEIAAVAEAAGQLGVQREAVAGFTKTMIDLGETTNLTADEAATSIAQLMNVMGTAPANVGRLGATLVALGNAGASTERDILQMGQRIAGAGKQIGLSEGQVLGFASAISSVGVEVEAGGTAISTTFLKMDQAVRNGGKGLDILARTAGMSSAEFRKAFQQDAAGAVDSFIQGLGQIQAEGGNTNAILKDLGITGIREGDTLRRLASSGTILSDSLKLQGKAWQDNNALLQEAATRYATTESQARVAWNQIKDAAITGGQAILPVVAEIATGIGKVAELFGSMPGPARSFGTSLVVAGTAMALIGGGALKAVTGLAQLRTAYATTAAAASTAGRAMKIAQLSIPVVGIALFAATTAMQAWAGSAAGASAAATEYSSAMQTIEGDVTRATAALNENVRAVTAGQLQQSGALDWARTLGIDFATLTDAALGTQPAIDKVNAAIRAGLGGNRDQVGAALDLGRAYGTVSRSAAEQVKAEQDRRAATAGGVSATKSAGDAALEHAQKLEEEQQELLKAADAATELANQLLQLSGSQIGMEAAIDAGTESIKGYRDELIKKARDDGMGEEAAKKHADKIIASGKALDINTAAGRANKQALNGIAAATLQYTNQLVKAQAPASEVVAANERGRASFIKTARAMGASKAEATALASALFTIPSSVQAQVVVAGGEISKKQAQDLNKELKSIPEEKRAEIVTIAQTKGAKAAKQAMAEIKDKQVIARAKGELKGAKQVDAAMKALKDRLVLAKSRGDTAGATKLQKAINALKGRTVPVTAKPEGIGDTQRAINQIRGKQVTVTVKKVGVATGGLVTPVGPVMYSNGGPVWGAGTATSDSIPAMLSNGEYVINAKSVRMIGADRLQHMNATGTMPGFQAGGQVGRFAVGGIASTVPAGVDFARIYAMIVALTRPLAAVQAANTALVKARSVKAQEDRDVAAARRALARADTKKEKSKAKDALEKQLDQQKTAVERLRDATVSLTEAQKAVADSARQMSQTLSEPYRSTSNDIGDWLTSMREGAGDLKAFQGQIAQLRKLGVSETLVQQVVEKGAIAGSEVAQQIIAGGKAMAVALNQANGNLQKAADGLGYDVIQATGRYAVGGFISGRGTGTSDSNLIRASHGEYMVNAAATARNRSVLDAINFGRATVQPQFSPGFPGGGFGMPVSQTTTMRGGDVIANITSPDPDTIVRKIAQKQRNSLTMAGLRRAL